MRSNRLEVEAMLDGAIHARKVASGIVIQNNIKASIAEKGLVDTSRMLNDIQYHVSEAGDKVRVGSTIDNPPYPFFLEVGFHHHQSGELIGPYRFMRDGAVRSEGDLRRIWREPIRG